MNDIILKNSIGIDTDYIIPEKILVGEKGTTKDQYDFLINLYGIQFVYNDAFINAKGERIAEDDFIDNTKIHLVKGNKLRRLNSLPQYKNLLLDILSKLKRYLKRISVNKSQVQVYLYDKKCPDGYRIYNKINEVWSRYGITEKGTDKCILDSYCKMIGFCLTPDDSKRFFCEFYSPLSGLGKTYLTSVLLNRTAGRVLSIGAKEAANQFTFAGVAGNDFVLMDDVSAKQDLYVPVINNLVSNFSANREFKGRDSEIVEGLRCKIIMTTNNKFRPVNDVSNLVYTKMIELETNPHEQLLDKDKIVFSNMIYDISMMDQECFDEFFSLCVRMYKSDPDWIEAHTLAFRKDSDMKSYFNQIINWQRLEFARKLTDCIYDDADVMRNSETKNTMRIAYFKVCKYLSERFYKESCSLSRDQLVFSSKNYGKNEQKNFKLNDEMKSFILGFKDDDIDDADGITAGEIESIVGTSDQNGIQNDLDFDDAF